MGSETRRELTFNIAEGHFCLSGAMPFLREMCLGAPNPSRSSRSISPSPALDVGRAGQGAGRKRSASHRANESFYSVCSGMSHQEVFAPWPERCLQGTKSALALQPYPKPAWLILLFQKRTWKAATKCQSSSNHARVGGSPKFLLGNTMRQKSQSKVLVGVSHAGAGGGSESRKTQRSERRARNAGDI